MENHTNPAYNKRMHQTTDAKTQEEKLAEIASLIESIEDYVEKEGITIDNAERMEAIMYEGIPSEETSAFYGSRYYAIEDMMLQELY